jgi:hypothetical protein
MLLSHLMFLSFLVLLLVGHVLFDRIFATNLFPSPNTRCQDRKSYSLLSGADAKSVVRCVDEQDGEHGVRGLGLA